MTPNAGSKSAKKPTGTRTVRPPTGPITDSQLGQVAGVPTEADIEHQLGRLSTEDKKLVGQIRQLVASQLGSTAAARLWLVTPEEESNVTPIQAIRDGRAKQVLDALKTQWGRNPVYA